MKLVTFAHNGRTQLGELSGDIVHALSVPDTMRMAELLRNLQGKAVVSINDHPDIRRVFAGFDLVPLQLGYSIGGVGGRDKQFGELIIKSWDDRQAALL